MFSLLSHTFIHFCGVTLCRTFSQISDNFLSQIFVLKKKTAQFTNNYVLRCKVSGTLCVISSLCFLMFATKNKLISDLRNLGNSNVLKL